MEIKTEADIYSINLSKDLKNIICCLSNKKIEIWDIETFKKVKVIQNISSLITNVVFNPEKHYLIFTSNDYSFKIWSFLSEKICLKIDGHNDNISSLEESPDGKKIITASEDNTLKVWDISGKLLHTLKGHFAGIKTVAITPNSNLIISGSEDYNIRIWDIETGRLLKVLQDHEFSISKLKISSSSKFFISSSKEKTIIWDLETINIIRIINESMNHFAISPDEKYLLGSKGNIIRCYSLETYKLVSIQELNSEINFLEIDYTGKLLILKIGRNTIRKINIPDWLKQHKIKSPIIMALPFRAYKGDKPYIFVSYAHKDKNSVYPEMLWIKNQEFNIWYDEGIPATSEWPAEIEKAILNCSLFLAFITPNAVERDMVRNEINFALNKRKPFLTVYLEYTKLKKGLELRLSLKQALLKYELSQEFYKAKLVEALNKIFDNIK